MEFFASESEELIIFKGYFISIKQYHKRTPGLFKEFNGIGICLNAEVFHI